MESASPTIPEAAVKLDDLKQRDEFEVNKAKLFDEKNVESVAPPHEENVPEVVNTEIRDSKIGLIKLFIQLGKDGSMDYEEVLERIEQVQNNKLVSEDDANNMKKELDVAFGKTPEQIHDAKLGLMRLFIKMAKENQIEYEEVLERIQQVKDNNFISAEDQTELIHELDEVLGRTPEQIRASKIKLIELFTSLYQKGQMDKDEVLEHIDTMLENHHISKDDSDSLRTKLESGPNA